LVFRLTLVEDMIVIPLRKYLFKVDVL